MIVLGLWNLIGKSAATELSGTVGYLSGNAWKIVNGRRVEIKENDTVVQADELQTDDGSTLMIRFTDNSTVTLDHNTRITIESLKPQLMEIQNWQGGLFSRVTKDPEHRFAITAKGVRVEALGTVFAVENHGEVTVSVFESVVKVERESHELVQVKAHEQWRETTETINPITDESIKENVFLASNITETKEANELSATPELETATPTTVPTIKPEETAKPTPKISPKPLVEATTKPTVSPIHLTGEKTDTGARLNWTASGDTGGGFKLVKSLEANPTFPEDYYVYASDPNSRTYHWQINDGKKWHFRVCIYADGKCSHYSNEVIITAPHYEKEDHKETSSSVSSIQLTVHKVEEKAVLEWSVVGSSPKGFKVAWSKNMNPTYPPREGDFWLYSSSPDARRAEVGGLEAGQTYYFRVCDYSSSCSLYSNQATLTY